MQKNGFEAARTEYRRAIEKYHQLIAAPDVDEMADAWSGYLVSHNRIFTKMEQESKIGESKGWFDSVKNARKLSPELSYLQHARNADEHGIVKIHENAGADLRIGAPGEDVYIERLDLREGVVAELSFGGRKHPTISSRPRRIELIDVKDRNVIYPAPIDRSSPFKDKFSPVKLAEIGLTFAENILAQAAARL